MERVLARSNKVVVSGKGTTAPIILPPDVFRPRAPGAAGPPPAPADQSAEQQAQPQAQAQPGRTNP
jgi:membrane protease subunit HflK